jgi:hypothetical protein
MSRQIREHKANAPVETSTERETEKFEAQKPELIIGGSARGGTRGAGCAGLPWLRVCSRCAGEGGQVCGGGPAQGNPVDDGSDYLRDAPPAPAR